MWLLVITILAVKFQLHKLDNCNLFTFRNKECVNIKHRYYNPNWKFCPEPSS